jgi:hypothetical protein
MLGRVLAFAIAVAVGATGVLPTGDGARCLVMNKRVAVGEDCCPKCESPPVTAIGTPCCEVIHGRALEARAPASVVPVRIAPAPLTAVLPAPAVVALADTIALRSVAALPRGRPPGEQLHRFSTILRI